MSVKTVEMSTVMRRSSVLYKVLVDGKEVWSKTVEMSRMLGFGAGGVAFQQVAQEQERVAREHLKGPRDAVPTPRGATATTTANVTGMGAHSCAMASPNEAAEAARSTIGIATTSESHGEAEQC